MTSQIYESLKAFFIYPYTLLAVAFTALCHLLFYAWFQPSLGLHAAVFVVDIMALCLWFPICMRSKHFERYIVHLAYKAHSKNLRHTLSLCHQDFKTPALECMRLAYDIGKQFSDHLSKQELNHFLDNLNQMVTSHVNLLQRSAKFGTEAQQQRMTDLIASQVRSMETTLDTLRSFSGNLTLLAANLENQARVAETFKAINEGLHEVMQEFENHESDA